MPLRDLPKRPSLLCGLLLLNAARDVPVCTALSTTNSRRCLPSPLDSAASHSSLALINQRCSSQCSSTRCHASAESDDDLSESSLQGHRRQFLTRAAFSITSASLATGIAPPPANAAVKAKGAAEYDLEYYMRDLVKGNNKEGNRPASTAPPAPPPRTLKGPLPPLLLNDALDMNCAPVRALRAVSGATPEKITEAVASYRERVAPAFFAKAPWSVESVSDQYYFDLTAYAFWRTAADLITDYVQRDKFARQVGREIYADIQKAGLVQGGQKGRSGGKATTLTGTISTIVEVLDLFSSSGYCKGYRLGGEDAAQRGSDVFDQYDDDDITSGLAVDCLVSVYEPAVLSASLQITGEQSRFSPDFVGATLAAIWEESGVSARYESYFVDPVYRPNPKDFFPNERLIQFTLKKA